MQLLILYCLQGLRIDVGELGVNSVRLNTAEDVIMARTFCTTSTFWFKASKEPETDCRSSVRAEAWAGSPMHDRSAVSIRAADGDKVKVNVCAQVWKFLTQKSRIGDRRISCIVFAYLALGLPV